MVLPRRLPRTSHLQEPLSVSAYDVRLLLVYVLPGRLSGTQVSANDMRIRIFVAHFHSPDACSRAYIKNSWKSLGNWCQVELIPHRHAYHLMCEIEAIQLALHTALVCVDIYGGKWHTSSFGIT